MTMSLWEAQLAAHTAQHGRDDNDDDGYTSPIERHDRESTTRALQPIPVNGQGDKAPTPSSSPGKRAPSVSRPLPPNEPVVESGNHPRFFGYSKTAPRSDESTGPSYRLYQQSSHYSYPFSAGNYHSPSPGESYTAWNYRTSPNHYLPTHNAHQPRPQQPPTHLYATASPLTFPPDSTPNTTSTGTSMTSKKRLAPDDGNQPVKRRASAASSEGKTPAVPTAVCITCGKPYVHIGTHFTRAAKSDKECGKKRLYRRLLQDGQQSKDVFFYPLNPSTDKARHTKAADPDP